MKKITIVTHSSKFHTDDIFAVATLTLLLEKDHDVTVVRSRDKAIIDSADYVVDVGWEYDPSRNRFDHHQEGGAGKRENTVPYASFGLVWKHYGATLCGSQEIADRIDQVLVQPIDAWDNGIQFSETKIEGLYPYNIKSITYAFRPTWKEEEANLDEIFSTLVSYAKVLLEREIKHVVDDMDAEKNVLQAYEKAEDKRLIILDERYPWEEMFSKIPEPLFVIYPKRVDNTWSLKAVRNDLNSYESRKNLPESWAGKSGEEFEKITGVPGSIFCHNNRFLAVAQTKEATLKLAEIALNS